MHDRKNNSIAPAQHAAVETAARLMLTAERELASFYEAVLRQYGLNEARKAAHRWIEELATADWPADGALPNWRRLTIVAAGFLACRIVGHSPTQ